MRYAAGVEYVGTAYAGWQFQKGAESVQQRIESALTRIAAHPVQIMAAGRTDAGVHACGQVIHFDSDAPRQDVAWLFGANSLLPPDIALRWIQPIAERFHARFSAVSRVYRYYIVDTSARSALLHHRAAWSRFRLDAASMHLAGQHLLGENDFSAFRAVECQSSTPMREITRLIVERRGDQVLLEVEANAFLHHMVRNIAGSLMEVGRGRYPPGWIAEVLQARRREAAGPTAPACGLYFWKVRYPSEFNLPAVSDPEQPGFRNW